MHLFAAAADTNTLDRLRAVPSEFWIRIGIAILILIVAVVLLRKLAKMNKVVLGVAVFLVITFVGFNWVYERNEPAWATPVVNWLADFFPTKAGANPR